MRNLLFLTFCFLSLTFSVKAQEIADHAIGLRIGDSNGLGAEISYQHALGDNNRIEADLGWRNNSNFNSFQLTGLYQWVFQLENSFNWYAGAGAGIAAFNGKKALDDVNDTSLFVAGDVGIEYNFDIPLLLSLDFRPVLGFGDFSDDLEFDIALGIRYQF